MPRLTHERAAFTLQVVPAGWHCSTAGGVTTGLTRTGQCTTHGGGIVEWLPKLKTWPPPDRELWPSTRRRGDATPRREAQARA